MAHVKTGGSTRLGRDSHSKRLGVKLFGGQKVFAGNIIVRQRGSKWKSGEGTYKGKDDTIMAEKSGVVEFKKSSVPSFKGKRRPAVFVTVK
ncbi:MAG: 50S ribosomal protein L27 [Patescibacteria group bacterium]